MPRGRKRKNRDLELRVAANLAPAPMPRFTQTERARLVTNGMNDAAVEAFVIVMGALHDLPTERAKARVLGFVKDLLDERHGH